MFSILNRALSWAITSFGDKFCLKKRSRLIKALDNRFYVKFMQLGIGLLAYLLSHESRGGCGTIIFRLNILGRADVTVFVVALRTSEPTLCVTAII